MRLLYTLALYLLFPLVLLRLIFRAIRQPAYGERWRERLGYIPAMNSGNVVWIHAVSIGEVNAARPLIKEIIKNRPDVQLVVTTMTPAGAQAVKQHFGGMVMHSYIPFDLPGAVRRFLSGIKPRLGIIMETEIWPNLYYRCAQMRIPVVLANARLSEKSFTRYSRIAGFTSQALQNLSLIAARGQADADRFIALGASADRVKVTGNLKFDIELPKDLETRLAQLHRRLPPGRPVWIAASTHAGEEKIILDAHAGILKSHPDSLLIIAPRHPERFNTVAQLTESYGYTTARMSDTRTAITPATRVCILDTLGELPVYYGIADVAFTGGSLVPAGGHNMLEAASLGIPVIMGPHNHNFLEISVLLTHTGAAWMVQDAEQLASQVNILFSDQALRHSAGEKGRLLVQENRGSVLRLLESIRAWLNMPETSGIN